MSNVPALRLIIRALEADRHAYFVEGATWILSSDRLGLPTSPNVRNLTRRAFPKFTGNDYLELA